MDDVQSLVESDLPATDPVVPGWCWFCDQRAASFAAERVETVYRFKHADCAHDHYDVKRIAVPRCAECYHTHCENVTRGMYSFFGSVVLGMSAYAYLDHHIGLGILVGVLSLVVCLTLIHVTADKSVKPASYASRHPSVQKLLDDGWQYGEPG